MRIQGENIKTLEAVIIKFRMVVTRKSLELLNQILKRIVTSKKFLRVQKSSKEFQRVPGSSLIT